MAPQNRLNVFLEILAELANLFFYVFFRLGLILTNKFHLPFNTAPGLRQ